MLKKFFLLFGVIVPSLLIATPLVEASQPVTVELVSEHEAVMPGQPFWVGIELEIEEGWHTSWKNPGDAGFAPQLEWDLPEGFAVNDVKWPYPEKFEQDSMVAFGYGERAMLLAEIIPPSHLNEGDTFTLGVDVMCVACKDSCVPINHSAAIQLKVENGKFQLNQKFEDARKRLPQLSDEVVAAIQGDQLILRMQGQDAYFFPDREGAVAQSLSRDGDELQLTVDDASLGSGVLVLMDGLSPVAYQIEDVLAHAAQSIGLRTFSITQLLLTIGGAFLGGLILNLMPCVLPVISLKILSFVNLAGSDRKKIFQHGMIFTIGVLISFWVLAGALLILRAYGASLGWGFQLQEPIFVVVMMMVIFLLALSLLGVFEFGTSLATVGQGKQRKGLVASFMSGVLATIVATPCTGPFLAPALGFAITLPAFWALTVFTMMGLGMASPYLFIAAFPKLLNRLPKPGPWMVVFKQVMGFIMLATVLWLLWVFQSQVMAPFAVVSVLISLFVLGLGAWVYGRWGNPLVRRTRRYLAYGVTALLVAIGVWFGTSIAKSDEQMVQEVVHEGWVAWDPDTFAKLRAEGTPVFVDFTAKWCLICQANKVPINSSEVRQRFKEAGVVLMEADWTRRDPVITEELAKFDRNGVPLYVLYGADGEEMILPQMLTKNVLLESIKQLND